MSEEGRFIWYDLLTPDPSVSQRFYSSVVGWEIKDSGHATQKYLVLHAPGGNGMGVGGMMELGEEMRAANVPPHWGGYVYVNDVDASAKRLVELGGKLHRPPEDIPHVGRFAVVSDPKGASFYLFKPNGPDAIKDEHGQGYIGWRELHSTDPAAAFAFYCELLGWKKTGTHDMGPHGTYDLVAAKDGQRAGMMRGERSAWLFYFSVPSVEAAVARCKEAGGKVVSEPHQQPEGGFIARCTDPHGAVFALAGGK